MRTGNNIRQRKDGRFEARYEKSRDEKGRIVYGYIYADTFEEAEKKRSILLEKKNSFRQMNLLILGAGDYGQEVRELVNDLRVFHCVSFLDDNPDKDGILGSCDHLEQYIDDYPMAIAAIGDSVIRKKWIEELKEVGFVIPTIIHPNAVVASNAIIGPGTVICSNATISQRAKIGVGCIIDSGAVVERGSDVPDWTFVQCGSVFSKKGTI